MQNVITSNNKIEDSRALRQAKTSPTSIIHASAAAIHSKNFQAKVVNLELVAYIE